MIRYREFICCAPFSRRKVTRVYIAAHFVKYVEEGDISTLLYIERGAAIEVQESYDDVVAWLGGSDRTESVVTP